MVFFDDPLPRQIPTSYFHKILTNLVFGLFKLMIFTDFFLPLFVAVMKLS
jgi:hypothetical protein